MSSLTLSHFVVTVPKRVLESLSAILTKAEKHENAASFIDARLVEDMKPFSFQVHCVTDNVSKGLARSQGTEPAAYEDNLKTFAEMHDRIKEVSAALEKADIELINKREAETVTLGLGRGNSGQMKSVDYITNYSAPNVYFHLNMAYAIVRKEGVDVGKLDYLNPFLANTMTVL
ncbi:hypothetical protein LIA77_06522 [Sarocladium implicatum]|nr:hypothetical protein LIA77_06522 [Sarocladium implicatum]